MTQQQKNNPLHGVKLEALLLELLDNYHWDELAEEINLNCFKSNPSVKSSLKFLRKFEWARDKVERFYLYDYKGLPRPGMDEFDIPPRKRMIDENGFPTGEMPDDNYTPQRAKSSSQKAVDSGKPSKSGSLYGAASKAEAEEPAIEEKGITLEDAIEKAKNKETDTAEAEAIAAVAAILESVETPKEEPNQEVKEEQAEQKEPVEEKIEPKAAPEKEVEIAPLETQPEIAIEEKAEEKEEPETVKKEEKPAKKSGAFNPWANSKHVK